MRPASHGGPRAGELSRSLYYNDGSETALSAIPLQSGDSYTAEVFYPVQVDPEDLEDLDFATVVMPELAGVPQVVPEKAVELTGPVGDDPGDDVRHCATPPAAGPRSPTARRGRPATRRCPRTRW